MTEYKFDKNKHVHTLGGKRLHGVTTVLGKWGDAGPLLNWGVNCAVDYIKERVHDVDIDELANVVLDEARQAHIKKRDTAGDIGTQIHEELETAMQEWIDTGDITDNHSDTVLKVVAWMKDNDIVPYKSEANLYSEEMWVGGICDLVAKQGDKTFILDFKTSNTVQTKMFYQMGAYSAMYTEMAEQPIDGLCIIHVPKGKFSPDRGIFWRYDVLELENAFKSILEVYKLDKEISKLIRY